MTSAVGFLLAAALSASPVDSEVTSLAYGNLPQGQRFEIATGDQVFRAELVDPATGECSAATALLDRQFGRRHRVWFLGATQGTQPGAGGLTLVLMNQIRVGMRMELAGDLGQQSRQITTPVTSIRLMSAAPSALETALR